MGQGYPLISGEGLKAHMKAQKLILPLFLSGCAAWQPYAELGMEYPIPISTDYWVHPDRSWQCEPPNVHGEVGVENKDGWQVGLVHLSTLLCGSWNHKPEIYRNGIKVTKKWGGHK